MIKFMKAKTFDTVERHLKNGLGILYKSPLFVTYHDNRYVTKSCFKRKNYMGLKKIISMLMIFLVLFSDAGMIFDYGISYASNNVNDNKNIDFNAYFVNNVHEITYKVDSNESKFYINLNLRENGYLKNAVISLENENFDIVSENIQNENVEKIENNVITIKQINSETPVLLELPIKFRQSELININMFEREFTTKVTGTFVDSQANEIDVQMQVKNKINWSVDAKINTTINIQKYIPFNNNGNYGVLLQIRANTNLENNIVPVKNTNLKVQSPEINGQKVSKVKVASNRTTATNGNKNGIGFSDDNWKYNDEIGLLEINVENQINEKGEVSWVKDTDDEYLISYIYEGKEIYEYVVQNGFNSNIKMITNISTYINGETKIEENVLEGKIELKQNVSNIVNFELISEETQISKGYIYSNYEAKEKQEIEYNLKYVADIGYAEILDYIQFEQNSYDEFLTEKGEIALTTIGSSNYTKNKDIKVNVSMFNKLLGNEGFIEVYDENNERIGIINKDTQKENDAYIINLLKYNNNKLKIKTSKPISEGKLSLNVTKVISSKIDYSKEQMKTFTYLKSSLYGKDSLTEMTSSDTIKLSEPITKAKIKFNSDENNIDLSTTKKYDNLEMRIILDTSNTSNALYKNPSFEVRFPKVIKNVIINDIKLINENNLKIIKKTVEHDETMLIKIELEGMQTDYNVGEALKGTNIIVNFGIELDKLAISSKEKIIMTYTNENSNLFENVSEDNNGNASIDMNIIAPVGIITASGMSGYINKNLGEVYTVKDKKTIEKLSINDSEKTIKITNDIVNNYKNSLGDFKILGKFPVTGTTILEGQEQLKNNIDTKILSKIEINDYNDNRIKIFYTENENPSNDLNNEKNGWSENPSNMDNIKSYMIVLNEEFEPGSHLNFKYEFKIPANLEFSKSAYTKYTAYFNNLSEFGSVEETKEGAIMGVTTGIGPSLNIKLEANREENSDLQAGGITKFKALITNNGEADATNVKLAVPTPDGTKAIEYDVEYDTYNILPGDKQIYELGNIKSGETITKVFEIQMMGDLEMFNQGYRKQIVHQVFANCNEDENSAVSNNFILYKIRGDLEMELIPTTIEEIEIQRGARIIFKTYIDNISNDSIENLTLTSTMPDGVKIIDGYFEKDRHITEDKVNIKGNTIEGIYPTLKKDDNVVFKFEVEIEDFEGELNVKLEGNGDKITSNFSNELKYKVNAINVSFEQTSLSPDYVQEGEELKFRYIIKNNGNSSIPSLYFTNEVPTGLKFKKMTEGIKGEESLESSNSGAKTIKTTIIQLEPGEEYIIDITFTAMVLSNENTCKVENYGILNIVNRFDIESNKVTKYVEYNPKMHGQNSESGRYTISGLAWNDINVNGQRDINEELIGEIKVILINKSTNKVMKDLDTNEEKIAITDANGAYKFENIPVGEYNVAFLYDTEKYELSEYQKKDVNQTVNSDAIEVELTYDGDNRKAGMTDGIKIISKNVRNIDIGLCNKKRFDLRLKKEVKKITLTTPTIGTKEYTHNNSVAKVEVLNKNVGKSTMVVEYKIVVKNEGRVPGYVRTIVDYIPDEFTFNSSLNKQWYEGKDGNIYTSCLKDEEIQPGEEKEISLIVSKKITDTTIGIINNTAEIYEDFNEFGLKDVDSKVGNRASNEDDIGSSDVVVSLVTGKIVTYTVLICIILGMLTIGIYLIRIKVLNEKKK